MSTFRNLMRDLQRRGVFRVAGIYIVAAWVTLQVADLAFAGLGIPEIALRYVWIAVLLGFPLAVIFGWLYDVTPEGLVRTKVSGADSTEVFRLRRTDYVLLAALCFIAVAILIGVVSELRSTDATVPAAETDPMSIAVLPLDNLSGNPDQEYFVTGMHDELITVLSRISGLRVTSRTSAARYPIAQRPAIPEIGRQLGVATILEGSVYRVDDEVRINLRLVRTDSDEHLWADAYERDIRDVLSLQSEVARAVAKQVKVTLTPAEEARFQDPGRVNSQVYEIYQQGLFLYRRFTPDSVEKAEAMFQRAIELDPYFARAYVGLGNAQLFAWEYGGSTDRAARDRVLRNSILAAERAIELDPELAEAYLIRAYAASFDPEYEVSGQAAVERALELSPSLAMAHHLKAQILMHRGKQDAAILEQRIAIELDPFNAVIVGQAFSTFYHAGLHDDALEQINKAIELEPDNVFNLVYRGRVFLMLHRYQDALIDFDKSLAAIPEDNWFHAWVQVFIAQTHAYGGDIASSEQWLETIRYRADGYVPPVGISMVHIAQGRYEDAIDQLELGYKRNEEQIGWIVSDPVFDPLRDRDRFIALLEDVMDMN